MELEDDFRVKCGNNDDEEVSHDEKYKNSDLSFTHSFVRHAFEGSCHGITFRGFRYNQFTHTEENQTSYKCNGILNYEMELIKNILSNMYKGEKIRETGNFDGLDFRYPPEDFKGFGFWCWLYHADHLEMKIAKRDNTDIIYPVDMEISEISTLQDITKRVSNMAQSSERKKAREYVRNFTRNKTDLTEDDMIQMVLSFPTFNSSDSNFSSLRGHDEDSHNDDNDNDDNSSSKQLKNTTGSSSDSSSESSVDSSDVGTSTSNKNNEVNNKNRVSNQKSRAEELPNNLKVNSTDTALVENKKPNNHANVQIHSNISKEGKSSQAAEPPTSKATVNNPKSLAAVATVEETERSRDESNH